MAEPQFQLHERLAADTLELGQLPLCKVLLSRDANYPWLVLVPVRADIREIHQLDEADRRALMDESCAVAEAMMALFGADKMNVAALGNMVPQLHVHHVARFTTDAAWPGPIWGAVPAKAYSEAELAERAGELRAALAGVAGFTAAR